jgi:hypothetical protein
MNFNKMTAKHWKEILKYYDTTPDSDIEGLEVGDQSILDEGHTALPMSSS